MRGVIKGALAEELDNSLRMKKEYEMALANLPKGCLAVRKIRGHKYYYLAQRVGKKVKHIYRGKISEEEIKRRLGKKLYKIGISFYSLSDAFKAKLVEQLYLIEEFRSLKSRRLGKEIPIEDAAQEWIRKYSKSFRKVYG